MMDFATPPTALTALAIVAPVPSTLPHLPSGHSTPANVHLTVSRARGLFPHEQRVYIRQEARRLKIKEAQLVRNAVDLLLSMKATKA